ncbi:MAG: siroheme synthase CysG [Halioglobus sp.]
MDYLPVCLRLKDSPVLLVGGGSIATRKARLLAKAGARITVVAPSASQELQKLLSETGGTWQQNTYTEDSISDATLVVAATADTAVNTLVYEHCAARRLPVNVVDSPHLCTFIFPSIVDRSPLIFAISSSGASPVLARLWRRKLDAMVPAGYGQLARWAGKLRDQVKQSIPDEMARRLFWEKTIEGPAANLLLAGREEEADQLIEAQLQVDAPAMTGEVYLVGAGPGDPDLMTFKAMRLLQSADVVLYDRLVAPAIVEMARRDAERLYVGKRRADHSVPQGEINQLLVDLALEGKRVIRLKGGDPFIFGRGGEEIELLAQHKIPFQVVPGITAASGAACYAGIPLTHRDYAQSVRFVTGHSKEGRLTVDWSQCLVTNETLVFYMGLVGLPEICEQLQAYGRDSTTPIALVEKGTMPSQRVLLGTLATMVELVEREQPRAPTLIIVGDVVRLAEKGLAWFSGDKGQA